MPAKKTRPTVTVTEQYSKALKDLVERGLYLNQGEAIRAGLRLLFKYHNLEIMCGELRTDQAERATELLKGHEKKRTKK